MSGDHGDRLRRRPGANWAAARRKHLRLGQRGETLAAKLLRELGLDVLSRNYRTPRGEIDIVAREEAVLCFVEVKTRRRVVRSRPADAVGKAKKRALVRTAHHYLRHIGRPSVVYRYDIVEVVLDRGRLQEARYWRAAFNEEDGDRGLRFPTVSDLFDDL